MLHYTRLECHIKCNIDIFGIRVSTVKTVHWITIQNVVVWFIISHSECYFVYENQLDWIPDEKLPVRRKLCRVGRIV